VGKQIPRRRHERRSRHGPYADTRPCGRDPLERFAWIVRGWRDQDPYTTLAFFRGEGVSAEQIALLHGADPEQVTAGTRLLDLRDRDEPGLERWETDWQTFCFGEGGGWAFLMYHETPPGIRADSAALARLGVTETVRLTATSAKAIYTFDYTRDGRRIDDDRGTLELIWYKRGRAPYYRGGQLDFLNRALRRAELDHPELIDDFELYFHALEVSLGLQLPQRDIREGTVRAAQWARGDTAGVSGQAVTVSAWWMNSPMRWRVRATARAGGGGPSPPGSAGRRPERRRPWRDRR
jgi:hypothetical protein